MKAQGYHAKDVQMFFDGERIDADREFLSFDTRIEEPSPEQRASRRLPDITFEMTVHRDAVDALFDSIKRSARPWHVSSCANPATLARRFLYGGRKGRSAGRRLRAMGYAGVRSVRYGTLVIVYPFTPGAGGTP